MGLAKLGETVQLQDFLVTDLIDCFVNSRFSHDVTKI